ncbi:Histone deacetylase [Bertholletia excelsa]
MEFWGVEVKAGQPLKVRPDVGRVIHISQAALGEGKKEKGSELIPLRVKINGDNFIVGSLSAENVPQVSFDLVFEKAFELSHDWKNGSVYFCGYSADNPFVYPSNCFNIGKIEPKAEEAKAAANKAKASKPESSAKPKVTVEPKKDESDEDDETEEDEDESDDEVSCNYT